MRRAAALCAAALLLPLDSPHAQQVADPEADLSVSAPRFPRGGPRVAIDEAHHNFHTSEGRYAPFAQLLRNDGFRVSGSRVPFTAASLGELDILVIANALAEEDVEEWRTPNPSAFTAAEIAALHAFVERGGALLLIADHMPMAGAAQELAAAFGVSFDNGFAMDGDREPDLFTRENGGLIDDPVCEGVRQVRTFTGSSFRTERAGVRPLLALGARWTILLPEEAWEFTDSTPRLGGEGRLQGALFEVGRGRLAVFGEAAMFTAQLAGPERTPVGLSAPGAEDNKRFVLNVLRWLARAQ